MTTHIYLRTRNDGLVLYLCNHVASDATEAAETELGATCAECLLRLAKAYSPSVSA